MRRFLFLLFAVAILLFIPSFPMAETSGLVGSNNAFALNEKLEVLGMVDAFNVAKAEFTGMTPRRALYIAHAVHNAYVEVSEEGTETAAATGIVMGIKSAPPVFRADHPLLFLSATAAPAACSFGTGSSIRANCGKVYDVGQDLRDLRD